MYLLDSLRGSIHGAKALTCGKGWSREELLAFQNTRLRSLVEYAYRNVPYHRQAFDRAGVRPEDIRTVNDLARLPITTRADLEGRPREELTSRRVDPKHLVRLKSSGSTGESFTFWRTEPESLLLSAFRLRTLARFGARLKDRRVAIINCNRIEGWREGPSPKRFYMKLGILDRDEVHCLLEADEILARLRELKPELLGGYGATLAWVGEHMSEADRRLIRPRFVTMGGEPVTPAIRRRIEDIFRCPVYSLYGTTEFNIVGSECPTTGRQHLYEDNLIVEVLRDGVPVGPGEEGELVGTALHCYAMPLIRYPLGDVVRRGEESCHCGAPYSTLSDIHGRTLDRFPLPGGESIHPWAILNPVLDRAPWVRQHEVTQPSIDRITLRLVAVETPSAEELAALVQAVEAGLNGRARVDIELTAHIEPGPSGKYRPFQPLAPRRET